MIYPDVVTRKFFERVDKSGDCWIWTGRVRPGGLGYGVMSVMVRRGAGGWKDLYAHRVSAEIHGAEIAGKCVLHKCDVPLCVNPAHLFTGTQADNMRDMAKKGRGRCGSGKLTAAETREIISLKGLASQQTIATVYGVSQTRVGQIFRGRTRKAMRLE